MLCQPIPRTLRGRKIDSNLELLAIGNAFYPLLFDPEQKPLLPSATILNQRNCRNDSGALALNLRPLLSAEPILALFIILKSLEVIFTEDCPREERRSSAHKIN